MVGFVRLRKDQKSKSKIICVQNTLQYYALKQTTKTAFIIKRDIKYQRRDALYEITFIRPNRLYKVSVES